MSAAARYRVSLVTLVPEIWALMLSERGGLVGRAFAEGTVELDVQNLKTYGKGKHRQVDDSPFGGGAGMVLAVEPLHRAIVDARASNPGPVLLLGPRGRRFDQALATKLASGPGLTLVCGRYEGVDERVHRYVDDEVSIGDFVLSAGDPAAYCMIDAIVRQLPGVLGNAASLTEESFGSGLLEYPHYTRPVDYDGVSVPEVLRSGDHARVAAWRREQSLELTRRLRPDLLGES
jgi:tRNA (guanine37-N1)-methyltransferase